MKRETGGDVRPSRGERWSCSSWLSPTRYPAYFRGLSCDTQDLRESSAALTVLRENFEMISVFISTTITVGSFPRGNLWQLEFIACSRQWRTFDSLSWKFSIDSDLKNNFGSHREFWKFARVSTLFRKSKCPRVRNSFHYRVDIHWMENSEVVDDFKIDYNLTFFRLQ